MRQRHQKCSRSSLRSKFGKQRKRPAELTSYSDSLRDAQNHEEYRSGDPQFPITGQKAGQACGDTDDRDVEQEGELSPHAIAQVAEDECSDETGWKSRAEGQIRKHQS